MRTHRQNSFIKDPSLVLDLPLYLLDGSSIKDRSAYGHLGVVTGALWTLQGRSFDGVDDYVLIADTPSLNILVAITIEAWVKLSSVTTYDVIVAKTSAAAGGESYEIFSDSAAKALMFLNPSATFTTTNVFYTVENWIHTVWTFSDADNKLMVYKNNVLFQEWTTTEAMGSSAGNVGIGRRGDRGEHWFHGLIGEVRLYNRALTAQEIQRNYLATKWRYR